MDREDSDLRDLFAGLALTSVIDVCRRDTPEPMESIEAMFARKAFAIADAMMTARRATAAMEAGE